MFANRHPLYTASKLPSAERIWGAILELVAAITGVFNIMDEKVLEAVVDESDVLAPICEMSPDFVTQKYPFCNWLINNILYLCIP